MDKKPIEHSNPELPMFLWEKGEKIDLRHYWNLINGTKHPPPELKPIEIHFKPDGDIHNRASIAIVLRGASGALALCQFSAESMKPIFRILSVLEQERQLEEGEV